MAGFAAELLLVLFSFLLYFGYHLWFFLIHGTGFRGTKLHSRDGRQDMFLRGKQARIQFSDLVARDDDTIAGIQQNRNGLLGLSFLAGTVSLIAQNILSIILDLDQQAQIKAWTVRLPHVFLPAVYADTNRCEGVRDLPPFLSAASSLVTLVMKHTAPNHSARIYCCALSECEHRVCTFQFSL
jgi:hypothetical protein